MTSILEQALDNKKLASSRALLLSDMPKMEEPTTSIADFTSNDYLSFASDSRVRDNFLKKLAHEKYILGSRASRVLDGNTPLAIKLEQRIQRFLNGPACLLFNSAYEANCGLFQALPQVGDIVVVDELAHASIHDGLRMSKAKASVIFFQHNSVDHLKRILQGIVENQPAIKESRSSVFVVIEGIYSMHGDISPLKEVSTAMKEILPPGVGQLYVDEAHSIGIIGKQGRGLVCRLNMEDEVQLRVYGFGKAMGTSGGVVLCSPKIRHYLLHSCRNLICTTACSQSNIIAMDNAIDILESIIGDEQLQKVKQITAYAVQSIKQMLQDIPPQVMRVDIDSADHYMDGLYMPIIPLITPLCIPLARYLIAAGYTAFRPITPPVVPKGHERIRWTLHADNTKQEVDRFVDLIQEWAKEQMIVSIKVVPVAKEQALEELQPIARSRL